MLRKITLIIMVGMCLFSCKNEFLDKQPDDMLNLDQVFASRKYTEQYLANVYSFIPDEGDGDSQNLTPASDEAKFSYSGVPAFNMNSGNWGPTYVPYGIWAKYYKAIRTASVFINRVDECEDMSDGLKVQYKAEARFLRSYFYSLLMRQYGPVILIAEPIAVDASPDDLQKPRNTYDECVDYVVSELDEAIRSLPIKTKDANQIGRVDGLTAMALKSRVLLYAASPLFNGNAEYGNFKNKDGRTLINTSVVKEKWKLAADAAKAVIDQMPGGLYKVFDVSGNLDPIASYRNVYFERWNKEIIWARISPGASNWEKNGALPQVGGFANYGVTQQQVDAFFMANGEAPITGYNANGVPIVNPRSRYVESGASTTATENTRAGVWNMYVNREPRFYATITYSGSLWLYHGTDGKENYYAEFFSTGKDGVFGGAKGMDLTRSGYAVRKYSAPTSSVKEWRFISNPAWTIFRLGEIYLNYAEALAEYEPGNADAIKYVNLIRERAGIPKYGEGPNALAVPANQEEFRKKIQMERRVELCFEMHRVFDTRRWKIATQTDDGPMWGMNMNAGTSFSDPAYYKRTSFETRRFEFKHYLWPLTQNEVDRNRAMVQNPGW